MALRRISAAVALFGSRRAAFVLAGLLVALHLAAFSCRAVVGANTTPDSAEYLLCARNAAEGLGFQANSDDGPRSEEAVTRRPPGYPALLLAVGRSGTAAMALQVLLSLATVGLCLLFLKRSGGSPASACFLLAGFLFAPSQIVYATSIMSEIPFQFCLTAGFLAAILHFEDRAAGGTSLKWISLSATAFCAGLLVKPVLYPAALLFSAAGLAVTARRREFRALPAVLAPALCVLALAGWNCSRTGAFEVSSIQTTNMLDVNMKMVLYQAEGAERAERTIDSLEAEAAAIADYPARQAFRAEQSRRILRGHPGIAVRQFAKGVVLFFLDPGRFDLVTYAGIDDGNGLMYALAARDSGAVGRILRAMPLWLWAVLAAVFAFNAARAALYAKFLLRTKGRAAAKVLLSCGIAYVALAGGPLGVSRYALPVVPLVLVGAALSFADGKKVS